MRSLHRVIPILATTLVVISFVHEATRDRTLIATNTPDAPGQSISPFGQAGEWTLLFNDEFDGTSLNRRNWTICYWWSKEGCTNATTNELQWYLGSQLELRDGTLRLRADERRVITQEGDTYPYTSGMITTGRDRYETSHRPRFAFQYGYAEMRAKVPRGQGLWSAFWMLPVSHRSLPEIDIMEVLGHETNTVQMFLHYRTPDGIEHSAGHWTGPDFSAGWHTFAVHWESSSVTWYVDGIERRRIEAPAAIPSEPMYLLANLAVGGDWPGDPDGSTIFPAYFDIDYIRVWKRTDAIDPGDTSTIYRESQSHLMAGPPQVLTILPGRQASVRHSI